MFFAPNPGILAAGVSTGKTYAEFEAHITALATGGAAAWLGQSASTGNLLVTATNESLDGFDMYGSPWMASYRSISIVARAIQHAMPDEAEFNRQRSSGLSMLITVSNAGTGSVVPLSRNGYTSLSSGIAAIRRVTEVLAWIDGPVRINPFAGTGPTPYDW